MADRLQKGHSDGSDNGGNGTLQGFELNRKIEGVEVGCVSAGHSRFNCIPLFAFNMVTSSEPQSKRLSTRSTRTSESSKTCFETCVTHVLFPNPGSEKKQKHTEVA